MYGKFIFEFVKLNNVQKLLFVYILIHYTFKMFIKILTNWH